MDNREPQKDIAAIERQGILGQQTVTPLSIQGNTNDSSDGWVHEWSKFFSLPNSRVEAAGNLGLWVSTWGLITVGIPTFPLLLIPSGTIILLLGITTYSNAKLAPMAMMRLVCIMAGISLGCVSIVPSARCEQGQIGPGESCYNIVTPVGTIGE